MGQILSAFALANSWSMKAWIGDELVAVAAGTSMVNGLS